MLIRKVLWRVEYEHAAKRKQKPVSLSVGIDVEGDAGLSRILAEECEHLLAQLDDEKLEQVVTLKLDGFSNEEIARQLGRSQRTVQRMLTLVLGIWNQDKDEPAT